MMGATTKNKLPKHAMIGMMMGTRCSKLGRIFLKVVSKLVISLINLFFKLFLFVIFPRAHCKVYVST